MKMKKRIDLYDLIKHGNDLMERNDLTHKQQIEKMKKMAKRMGKRS